jgi:hypothetical protein
MIESLGGKIEIGTSDLGGALFSIVLPEQTGSEGQRLASA